MANRTIRAHETIGPGDLTIAKGDLPGTYQDPDALTGLEARVVLYAGRPVRQGDLGPAAVVERNQVVPMRY
ncbi:MAG: flagella basal body P-ring formation protein FlgA, partial [Gemmatimonadetes bacterium]|nr:flagella basal body P-ring formation protein FlgA [Gemmatimonadota bacterium]NIT66390.1 flagella basal body P-ring formation protein FlgA [Gemmatimonadota bacterium]NIW74801.1 flagella basal body P-ring formation protein FlgA [Gemmatimonadota bacterium]NIY34967.1 flagella basal body P-ring formation protein FlgA [Gemmatimonadota bacterium]